MKRYRINQWAAVGSILLVLLTSLTVQAQAQKGEKIMTISSGKEVSLEYTLKLEDKTVIDTNVGSKPLTYTHGYNQLIPGLENALAGMKIGDSKQVTIKPEQAYGAVDKEAFLEVNKEQIPPEALKIDAMLQSQDAGGRVVHARITEIKDETVILDFNHPLAGKTLNFDVKVLNIQETPGKNATND